MKPLNLILTSAAGLAITTGIVFGLVKSAQLNFRERAREWLRSEERMSAVVTGQSYENQLGPVEAYRGLLTYSNETVKLDPKYTLTLQGPNGPIGLAVIDGENKTKEGLRAIIDPNQRPRISFPMGNMVTKPEYFGGGFCDQRETYFDGSTQYGAKRADRIKLEEYSTINQK